MGAVRLRFVECLLLIVGGDDAKAVGEEGARQFLHQRRLFAGEENRRLAVVAMDLVRHIQAKGQESTEDGGPGTTTDPRGEADLMMKDELCYCGWNITCDAEGGD